MRRFALPISFVMVMLLVAPAAADSQSATFKGPITGGTFYCGAAAAVTSDTWTPPAVTGTWTVTLSNDRAATVTVHAWYDGAHHMSTGHGKYQVSPAGDTVTMTLAIWTATIDTVSGAFTWAADLSAYYTCPTDDHAYDNLVYAGTIDH